MAEEADVTLNSNNPTLKGGEKTTSTNLQSWLRFCSSIINSSNLSLSCSLLPYRRPGPGSLGQSRRVRVPGSGSRVSSSWSPRIRLPGSWVPSPCIPHTFSSVSQGQIKFKLYDTPSYGTVSLLPFPLNWRMGEYMETKDIQTDTWPGMRDLFRTAQQHNSCTPLDSLQNTRVLRTGCPSM